MQRLAMIGLVLAQIGSAAWAAPGPDVAVTQAWARATLPHQTTAAVYMTLLSPAADVLSGVSSRDAGMAMLHTAAKHGSMEGMEDMDNVTLPANQPVVFAPNGMHIMLMDLKQPLKPGGVVHLRLQFAHRAQDVTVPVRPVSATGP